MSKRAVLEGIAAGAPRTGPRTVHIDVTNACNAACITCWDHSPLLVEQRSVAWKKRRIDLAVFDDLVADLATLGSVKAIILSGMGDPLVHPDIYDMIARIKRQGWHLTVMTNLIAADIDRLAVLGVDQFLVGVHGATPVAYSAFHPGWDEREFFTLCRYLRRLGSTQSRVRHVQVINRDTAPEFVDMVRFGAQFRADRVNFKLASLAGGTETCRITDEQRRWLADEAVPQARALAAELGIETNVELFARQLAVVGTTVAGHDGTTTAQHDRTTTAQHDRTTTARHHETTTARHHETTTARHHETTTAQHDDTIVASDDNDDNATVPIADVGCFMGYVYTRITASLDVLYCCNTEVKVGSLADARFADLWRGDAWQALRDRLRRGDYFAGCERCGKFEQNVAWSQRVRAELGDAVWRETIGADRAHHLRVLG